MQRSSVEDQRATSGDSGMERASNSDSRPGALSIEEAVALHRAGKLDEAESIYRAILDAVPLHADALHFLGVLLHGRGDRAASVQMLRKAIEQAPHNPSLWNNLGNVFLESRVEDRELFLV